MKKRGILVGAISGILALSGLGYFIYKKKKKNKIKVVVSEKIEEKIESPETILKEIIEELLEKGDWNTEKDFQDKLKVKYLKRISNFDFLEYLPYNLGDLFKKLEELGLSEKFSKELEKKYRVGN